jgi:hypothetical protein
MGLRPRPGSRGRNDLQVYGSVPEPGKIRSGALADASKVSGGLKLPFPRG